jgi:hypothetical protein
MVRPTLPRGSFPPVAFAGMLWLCGCGASASSPSATLDEFSDALAAGEFSTAYDSMSRSYRKRVSEEQFEKQLSQSPAEVRETTKLLARGASEAEITAEVPYAEGEKVELVFEDGDWKIASNLADFYDQSTPRGALRSFIRAIERRRYDVVLRLVPDADRTGMTAARIRSAWEGEGKTEIEQLLTNLRASQANPIEIVGDRATMAYGERFAVQFVHEDGVWRIEDPD